MLKFFRLPFATSGDKTAVPDAVDTNGNVSYTQGYGFDYQRQKTDPAAKNIERDKMNQIMFDITTAIAEIQAQGVPDFITSALNGGAAYSYAINTLVRWTDGEVYISLVAANTALPTDPASWAPFSSVLKGLGVTPAQFDNDTSLATTAFVQRALGSLSGFSTVNANTTLTAAHAGRGVYLSAAAVATLPLANTVPAGTLIYFSSLTSGAPSVARQSTDTIAAASGSSALTSMALLDGEDLILESNGNNQWVAIGGSARLKYAGGFGASLGDSGYQKLPSGLIIQWGTGTTNASGLATVTWPIAFPTAVLFAGAYLNNANNSTVQANTPTTTGCNVTSYIANTGAGQANNFRHLSIGH
jgi:hypothetical protein